MSKKLDHTSKQDSEPERPPSPPPALVEPPHLPGNYSARTSSKWAPPPPPSDTKNPEDEVHSLVLPFKVSPGQLYLTDSGRLFHAGKLLICLAGLPGRGKTHLSVALTRYLRWLGVPTQVFHFDDIRREYLATTDVAPEFFSQKPTSEFLRIKETVVEKCLLAIHDYFVENRGQVAIYDAINGSTEGRDALQKRFKAIDVNVLFIESLIDSDSLLQNSLRDATKSPDYSGWPADKATADLAQRIQEAQTFYEEIGSDSGLSFIKSINFGERLVMTRSQFGYLTNRMTFFLMNTRIKQGRIFFARCGDSEGTLHLYNSDPPLTEKGRKHAESLYTTLNSYMNKEGIDGTKDLVVWTSTRVRTVETGAAFEKAGIEPVPRSELTQLYPGAVDGMEAEEVEKKFPIEYAHFKKDPYHVRFPRGESYHDLAVRLEPFILEMERNTKNILLIGHESVLRVLYGYLLSCSSGDIPYLKFPPDKIVEVRYGAYVNSSKTIDIE